MTTTLNDRMMQAGLPYEITGIDPLFLMGSTSVVAFYQYGDVRRAFAGFPAGNQEEVARAARKIRGVYAAYVVRSEPVL